MEIQQTLKDLTPNDVIINLQSDECCIFSTLKEWQISGPILNSLDSDEKIRMFFSDDYLFQTAKRFIKRLKEKFNIVANTLQDGNFSQSLEVDWIPSNQTVIENPENLMTPKSKKNTHFNEKKSDESSDESDDTESEIEENNVENFNIDKTKKSWPHCFLFPKDRLNKDVANRLRLPEKKLKKRHVKHILDVLFHEIISFDLVYPESYHYTSACSSIFHAYKHLSSFYKIDYFKQRLRRRFTRYRKHLKGNDLVKEKTKKHTPSKFKIINSNTSSSSISISKILK